MVCDRTSTISYSMFFKAILKFLVDLVFFRDYSEILVGNSLNGLYEFKLLLELNKYSILKYISSLLVLDNQNDNFAWV